MTTLNQLHMLRKYHYVTATQILNYLIHVGEGKITASKSQTSKNEDYKTSYTYVETLMMLQHSSMKKSDSYIVYNFISLYVAMYQYS